MTQLTKRQWLLLLLHHGPLDRIRLMKALFLIWHRTERSLKGFFEFTPYLYGPFSLDVYRELEVLQREHLVSQTPHLPEHRAPYHLTSRGAREAAGIRASTDAEMASLVRTIAEEVASLGFDDLLRRVYSEAPDFATSTVSLRGAPL